VRERLAWPGNMIERSFLLEATALFIAVLGVLRLVYDVEDPGIATAIGQRSVCLLVRLPLCWSVHPPGPPSQPLCVYLSVHMFA
jgi:hypothetical protein